MKKLLLVLVFLFIVAPSIAYADLGPKPIADIDVFYNGSNVSDDIFEAIMLTCVSENIMFTGTPSSSHIREMFHDFREYDVNKNCYWVPDDSAWSFDCKNSKCTFTYMLPNSFKFVTYLSSLDKVFITNEISRTSFRSSYKVDLKTNGEAVIAETTSILNKNNIFVDFSKALIITLFIELFVAFFYVKNNKLSKKILLSVMLGTVITLPVLWLASLFIKSYSLLVGEILVFIFEAYFIYYLNKKNITLKKSFYLSLIINLSSFIIGSFIAFILSPYSVPTFFILDIL